MLCSFGCKRDRIIPDDTLADIFHDAFLVNAYVGVKHLDLDSLEIYEPVFEKYGYTSEDVRTTVGNFSRRKSARLGSVVNMAIERLETESKKLEKAVVILDTIREYSKRAYTRQVYADTLISVKKRADSVRLSLVIEPVHKGDYVITYRYETDEDVRKYPREAKLWFETDGGSKRGNYTFRLRKKDNVKRTLTADGECRTLHLDLGSFTSEKERPRKQNLEIRDLKIKYIPDEKLATDSLFTSYVDIILFADEFMPFAAQDSLASAVDSLRLD